MVDLGVGLRFLQTWWDEGNGLAAVYGVLALIALIQLKRIHGWIWQKFFHLLNFVANGVRAVILLLREDVQELRPEVYPTILLDLPGLFFFSAFIILVLVWAFVCYEEYGFRVEDVLLAYLLINAAVYVFQAFVWVNLWWNPQSDSEALAILYSACLSLAVAAGLLLYGTRLFLILRRFPIKANGPREKLWEVGSITGICVTCFTVGSVLMSLSIFSKKSDLNASYYTITEIIPSAYVMYVLREAAESRIPSASDSESRRLLTPNPVSGAEYEEVK